jgi:hypothetical protein
VVGCCTTRLRLMCRQYLMLPCRASVLVTAVSAAASHRRATTEAQTNNPSLSAAKSVDGATSSRATCACAAGYTPLHMAAGYMHTTTIAALLAGGADPEQEDRQQRRWAHSPLQHFLMGEGCRHACAPVLPCCSAAVPPRCLAVPTSTRPAVAIPPRPTHPHTTLQFCTSSM